MRLRLVIVAAILVCFTAQAETVRGTPILVSSIYLSPDITSNKLADIDRGREVVILETSRDWLHVEAALTEEKIITGWMLDKGVVQGLDSEWRQDRVWRGGGLRGSGQPEARAPRRRAGCDASLLPDSRVFPQLPDSPGEAMYRFGRHSLADRQGRRHVASFGKEKEAYLREGMDDDFMKEVMKKFPGTKWADLAAFHLIDNKLCGEWQGVVQVSGEGSRDLREVR